MDINILKNPFVIFIVSFIVLYILFYIFNIGYTTKIQNGVIIKKVGWKYPLAIALILWLIWYFILFPPHRHEIKKVKNPVRENQGIKIDMENWL